MFSGFSAASAAYLNDGIFADQFIQAGVIIVSYKLKLMQALMFDPYLGFSEKILSYKKIIKILGMVIKSSLILSALIHDFLMVLWIIKKYRIHIIHFNAYSDYYIPLATMCHLIGKPIIFHVRGKVRPSRHIVSFMKYVDAFIHVSKFVQENFTLNDLDTSVHYCVYNGRSPDDYTLDGSCIKSDFKKSLRIPTDHKIVVCVGTLTRGKGQATFIDAANIVCEMMDDVSFLIVGDNVLYEDDVKTELFYQIDEHGLNDRILLLGQRDDIPHILSQADVSVSSSELPEALCGVNIEAMAAHTPVVSTDVGSVREVVKDGETGILVEPSNPDQMAKAILSLLGNNELAYRLVKAGYKKYLSKFDAKKTIVNVQDIYKRILFQ